MSAATVTTASTDGFVLIGGANTVATALIGSDGNDTITASTLGLSTITGGKGDDGIALNATAKNTVIFESTAALNGNDTITVFTAGTTKDVLNFDAFVNVDGITTSAGNVTGTVAAATGVGTSDTFDIASKVVFLDTDEFADTTAILAGISDATGASNMGLADGAKAVILSGDVAAGAITFNMYYITGGTGATDTITLVGTVAADAGNALAADQFIV